MLDLKTCDKSPSVLVTATMWWPLSARLAMAFLRHGFTVASASPRGHPLRFVEGISKHYRYGGLHSLATLKSAIKHAAPQLIVPCDDGAVWQLHRLHEKFAELRPLIERSLGPPQSYPILRSRALMLQLASELGIRIPATRSISAGADLSATSSSAPAVLKVDGSCAGQGVRIARSPQEADEALRSLAEPVWASKAWKQLLVDRDPLPMYARREGQLPGVTLQQYIEGRPANTMLACWQGEVLAMVTVEVLTAYGATGAATVVRIIHHPEITLAARLLAKRLHLTGFHGLDFLLQHGTGAPFLIELNPRPTQLGHLRLPGQGDLVGAFCAALRGHPVALPDDPTGSDIIAFFPQAVSLNRESPYLKSGYHDVPLEQPRLHRYLLRPPWPDRRLLARMYHFFYPRRLEREVVFENPRAALSQSLRPRNPGARATPPVPSPSTPPPMSRLPSSATLEQEQR